jgi:hypothetical protein
MFLLNLPHLIQRSRAIQCELQLLKVRNGQHEWVQLELRLGPLAITACCRCDVRLADCEYRHVLNPPVGVEVESIGGRTLEVPAFLAAIYAGGLPLATY